MKTETGCSQTAAAAYQHAVAKAAYDNSLSTTGCSKTADAAYETAAVAAAADLEKMDEEDAS